MNQAGKTQEKKRKMHNKNKAVLAGLILLVFLININSIANIGISIGTGANNAPILKNVESVQIAVVGEPFELDIDAADKDNDILEYSVQFEGNNLFGMDSRTGIISFTPTEEQVGEHNILVRVSDKQARDFQNVRLVIKRYKPEFIVNKTFPALLLKIGEQEMKALKVKNTGKEDLDITIKEDFDFIEGAKQARIAAGREEEVSLNFSSNKTGVFTGSIFIKSASVVEELPLIVEVESKNVSIDAGIEIDSISKKFYAGDELIVKLFVFNFLNKKEDVVLEYKILDVYNNIITNEHETLAVITKNTLIRKFHLPSYLPEGDYVIAVAAKYKDSIGTSSSLFHIVKNEKKNLIDYIRDYKVYIFILLIAFLILIISFVNYIKLKGIERFRTPVKVYSFLKKTSNAEKAVKKINKQIFILENAFSEGYINRSSYYKSKKKLEKMIKEARKQKKAE